MKVFQPKSPTDWTWEKDLPTTDGMYRAVLPDPQNKQKIWIVMHQSVKRMNLADRTFDGVQLLFTPAASANTQTALADSSGRIWVGSTAGLWWSKRPTYRRNCFLYANGLRSIEFVDNAALRLRNGALVFGTTGGFGLFLSQQINPMAMRRMCI